MTTFRSRSADAAEIFALEHRFPLAATLFAMFVTGNIGSAVMMLLAAGLSPSAALNGCPSGGRKAISARTTKRVVRGNRGR